MDQDTLERVKDDLLGVRFEHKAPVMDAEYWLFGAPAASLPELRTLPSLFGLCWSWHGDSLVVDFIDGPEAGGSELLSWSEFTGVAAEGFRLLVRWTGFRLPVRVLVCPSLGVRVAIEHMTEIELLTLHKGVAEKFVQGAIEGMHECTILVGCDTTGATGDRPERLVSYGSKLSTPLVCPDYLLTHKSLALSAVEMLVQHRRQVYDELCLIRTWT